MSHPLEIPPWGKGRTPPGSHGDAVPNSQLGPGAASAPVGMGDEDKSQLLSPWRRLGAFGSSEIHRFSCLAWEHPVLDSSSESAGRPQGSALFRNCSASYSGQQFQPWEAANTLSSNFCFDACPNPQPDLSNHIFQLGALSPTPQERPELLEAHAREKGDGRELSPQNQCGTDRTWM